MTGSVGIFPDVSGSTSCCVTLVEDCSKGGGGELSVTGLGLRLGDRDGLRFLSRFTGDLRRGDGDLVFRLTKDIVQGSIY